MQKFRRWNVFQKRLTDLSVDSFFLHVCDSLIFDISPLLRFFLLKRKTVMYVY